MSDLEVTAELLGSRVCLPNRPEWGSGEVLRVQATRIGGQPVHRVSIQFPTGHRTVVVPPGRLALPVAEPEREAGWLDEIGGMTLDDRLTQLPPESREVLGTPARRLAAMAPLFELSAEGTGLVQWALRQANVADPLSLWSRDELLLAFNAFCHERDGHLRLVAALLKQAEGAEALAAVLAEMPEHVRSAMTEAMRRVL